MCSIQDKQDMIHLFGKTSPCVRVHLDSGPSHLCWLVASVTKAFQYRRRLCRRHTSKSQLRQWMSKIRADVFSLIWMFEGSDKKFDIMHVKNDSRKKKERSFSPPYPVDASTRLRLWRFVQVLSCIFPRRDPCSLVLSRRQCECQ